MKILRQNQSYDIILIHANRLVLSPIEGDSSTIERLYGSEVVHNIMFFSILESPELFQLLGGDLDGVQEVDPVDNLHAAGGGQGASIVAVSWFVTICNRSYSSYKV